MPREKGSYAIALFALKLPPGCLAQVRPGGVTFAVEIAAPQSVEVFLRAGYARAGSAQEAEDSYLEFLLGHLPASNGWACHSVRVQELSDLDELFDELIEQVRRSVPLYPEDPGREDEDMPELPM